MLPCALTAYARMVPIGCANVQTSRVATKTTGGLFHDAIHAPTVRITIAKANAAAGSISASLRCLPCTLLGLWRTDYRNAEFVSIEILTESFVAVANSASKHGSQATISHGCSRCPHLSQIAF